MTLILEPEEGLEALGEVNRLAQFDGGSGIIEPQPTSYLDSLGDDAYDVSCLRITGQTLLGGMLTGLGENEHVAEVLRRDIQDSVVLPEMSEEKASQGRATQVVVVWLLRIAAQTEAVGLRNVVVQQCLASQIPPVMCVVLILTVDVLDATRLNAHPDDMMRVVLDYAN